MWAVAVLPVILTPVFGLLLAYFRSKGGYKAVKLTTPRAPDPDRAGKRTSPCPPQRYSR